MKKNFSDYLVAAAVLVCSGVLLAALTFALSGWRKKEGGRTLEIDFPDITGIRIHSELRYAGAPAGAVSAVRLLSEEERRAAPEEKKRNAVRVSLRLLDGIPELPADVKASLASDTLLSEKFVALSAGSPEAPKLANGATLQGVSGGSFDDLINSIGPILHSVDATLSSLEPLVKTATDTVATLKTGIADVLPRINKVADSANTAAGAAEDLLKRADKLIADNEGGVKADLDELKNALAKLQDALKQLDGFVGNTDKQLAGRMKELGVILQNLKVATTHAKAFTKAIGEKPSRLIFSGKPAALPREDAILQSNKPLPTP
jgi:phospholipid/cholesterol/gamma-HCH transport system substrate-binding protein